MTKQTLQAGNKNTGQLAVVFVLKSVLFKQTNVLAVLVWINKLEYNLEATIHSNLC